MREAKHSNTHSSVPVTHRSGIIPKYISQITQDQRSGKAMWDLYTDHSISPADNTHLNHASQGSGRLITLRALSTSTASPTDSSQLPSGRWEQDTSHTFKIERRAQQPIPTPAEMCPPCRAQQRSQHAAGSGNSQPKKSQTAAVLVQPPKLCNWQVPAPAPGTWCHTPPNML